VVSLSVRVRNPARDRITVAWPVTASRSRCTRRDGERSVGRLARAVELKQKRLRRVGAFIQTDGHLTEDVQGRDFIMVVLGNVIKALRDDRGDENESPRTRSVAEGFI
jgi:hypothetical protein